MGKVTGQPIPAARRDGLVVKQLAEEVLVYDTSVNQAHCLNQTAARIWEFCDGQTTVDGIVAKLRADSTTSVDKDTVSLAIAQLDEINLLSDRANINPKGLSRRQLMRSMSIGALIAVPVVVSMLAPTAAQASTCVASGGSCTSSSECCSGLCDISNTCA